ncbi:uncharacterized mitochondrial protein-like protein [Tanacetum coccineum]
MLTDVKFINIFSTPVQEQGETSSRHVDSSNMHTFYQHHPSSQRWTKDHPLEQVIGNPSQSVRTRRQLETDGEMYHVRGIMNSPLHGIEGFSKGSFDPNYAITKHGEDIAFKFDMSMMGELKFFLGIQIHQSPRGIFINQAKFAQEILKKHGMTSCDSIGTPTGYKTPCCCLEWYSWSTKRNYIVWVGSLMDLTVSRPDIVHATCYCARYQAKPTEKYLTAVKRIFRYLKDSINIGLWYLKDTSFELTAFSDSDHAGCLDSRKSTSSGIQFLGGDKLVSWSSKKQDCTSMSSAKAEYVSLSACYAQVLWLRTQLINYGFHFDKIPMYCDSKAAIAISCNPVQHSRTKHINVRYHFIKE